MKRFLTLSVCLLITVGAAVSIAASTMPEAKKQPDLRTITDLKIDKILILKADRKLYLIANDKKIKEYDIALGGNPIGAKEKQGDQKTPEGHYKISAHNPKSAYHLSLRINYPSEKDRANARKKGIKDPGGDIMIHGLPNGMGSVGRLHLLRDWTLGCIAVTSEEIEEIYAVVKDGTAVEINP